MPLPKKRPTSKKNPLVGSGGQRRKALEGKGPTPKATDRPKHPAARKANAAAKRAAVGKKALAADRVRTESGGGTAGVRRGRPGVDGPEYVAGRNPVVEALRAKVPASALHIAIGIESDLRVSEAIKLAGDQRVPIIESSRSELDRFTERAMHQGLALQVPQYEYQHPDDLLTHALEQTVAGADRRARRGDRPAQPGRHHAVRCGVRRARHPRTRASCCRSHLVGVEGLGRCCVPHPGVARRST